MKISISQKVNSWQEGMMESVVNVARPLRKCSKRDMPGATHFLIFQIP